MSIYTTLAHLFVTLVVRCFSGAMWHLLGRFLDLLTAIRMQVAVAVSMCAVPPHSPACWSLRCTRHALYARLHGCTAPAAGTGTASHHIEHTTWLLDSTVLTQTTFYQLSQKNISFSFTVQSQDKLIPTSSKVERIINCKSYFTVLFKFRGHDKYYTWGLFFIFVYLLGM